MHGSVLRRLVLRLDHHATGFVWLVACLLLAIVVLLGLYQVVTRFVLEQPSTWTEEFIRRLLIWMVMLGTVAAFRQGALVSVDLMLRLSHGAWRRVVRGVIAAVTIVFLLVLVVYGVDLAWRVRFQTFASVEISMAWGYLAIPVGAAFSILAVIAHLFDPKHEELLSAQ